MNLNRIACVLTSASLSLAAVGLAQTPTPIGDACALLTATEAGAALGMNVIPGQHVGSSTLTCIYAASTAVGPGERQVIITLTPAQYFDMGKRSFGRTTEKPTSGVGQDAFYLENKIGSNIHVRKGQRAFELRVNPGRSGKESVEQIEALEKALAQKAAARL